MRGEILGAVGEIERGPQLSGRYSIIRPFGPKEMTEEYSFGVAPYHMKGSGEETVIHQRLQRDLTHVD